MPRLHQATQPRCCIHSRQLHCSIQPTPQEDGTHAASRHERRQRWGGGNVRSVSLELRVSTLCPGEGNGNPLQYSCLENPIDGGAWWAAVHGVAKSRTRLSDFTFTFQFHALEKEMATHSSVLAWRIPGTAEPGGLPPIRWYRVGHD